MAHVIETKLSLKMSCKLFDRMSNTGFMLCVCNANKNVNSRNNIVCANFAFHVKKN